jgi:hypothetical protein
MDYKAYQKAYITDPPPEPRFRFRGSFGTTLYYEDFEAAISYYENALGLPGYVEGKGTRGWRIGSGWLTILMGNNGNPRNVEISFEMETPAQAEKLQKAFIQAGGKGDSPTDELMYVPIRSCPVIDPFGTDVLVFSRLNNP